MIQSFRVDWPFWMVKCQYGFNRLPTSWMGGARTVLHTRHEVCALLDYVQLTRRGHHIVNNHEFFTGAEAIKRIWHGMVNTCREHHDVYLCFLCLCSRMTFRAPWWRSKWWFWPTCHDWFWISKISNVKCCTCKVLCNPGKARLFLPFFVAP